MVLFFLMWKSNSYDKKEGYAINDEHYSFKLH